FSSSTRNVALGRTSMTVPSISMASFATQTLLWDRLGRAAARYNIGAARAIGQSVSYSHGVPSDPCASWCSDHPGDGRRHGTMEPRAEGAAPGAEEAGVDLAVR